MRLWSKPNLICALCAPISFALISGCGAYMNVSTSKTASETTVKPTLLVTPSIAQLRANNTVQFSATADGKPLSGQGTWTLNSAAGSGSLSTAGLYSAPALPPSQPITVTFSYEGVTSVSSVEIWNPQPLVQTVTPATSSTPTTDVTINGQGYVSGSTVLVNGQPVPTTYQDASHLKAKVSINQSTTTTVQLSVANPDPGASTSAGALPFTFVPAQISLNPQSLGVGPVTLSVSAPGVAAGSVVTVGNQVFSTTSVSGNIITAAGFLPPWLQGSVLVSVTAPDGVTQIGSASEPITPTPASFAQAARFLTQAGWGPRPDMVLHVQQVGLDAFLKEQLSAPPGTYDVSKTNPFRSFFLNITSGSSLLRLRTAWAFQTFIPGQISFDHDFALPWEQTLERDAFANYRQILKDAASDPNIGNLLNMQGNAASTDPNVHPNQNFARELMQLFSIGTVMLNQDGTPKLDGNGHFIPAYDDNTVIDASRALTGWQWGTPQNPWFTAPFQWSFMDFSVPLQAVPGQHDMGAKTIFGTVHIPAGQDAAQDRDALIEAIMNHPNTAPFVSKLLIQRFTESQPSPAYVSRVASVFTDDGTGVKGNLAAVISAILLDPEARQGDEAGVTGGNGFLQDPVYQQLFLMSVLQISGEDDQSTYIFQNFSENLWNPGTVFGYFSPSYVVPGTSIVSPEFQLLTNFTDIQRSQFLYAVVMGAQPGFNNGFSGWLYDNFHTVPDMVDALNHLLYHGSMSAEEQQAIKNYCATLTDPRQQLESAVFLAMNADSYLVVH